MGPIKFFSTEMFFLFIFSFWWITRNTSLLVTLLMFTLAFTGVMLVQTQMSIILMVMVLTLVGGLFVLITFMVLSTPTDHIEGLLDYTFMKWYFVPVFLGGTFSFLLSDSCSFLPMFFSASELESKIMCNVFCAIYLFLLLILLLFLFLLNCITNMSMGTIFGKKKEKGL